MIINAAYEGPPYGTALGACGSCQTKPQLLGNTSPIAGLSYTTVGALVLTALTIGAVGLTLWSFRPSTLAGGIPRGSGRTKPYFTYDVVHRDPDENWAIPHHGYRQARIRARSKEEAAAKFAQSNSREIVRVERVRDERRGKR